MPPEIAVEVQKLKRIRELADKKLVSPDEVALQASIVENLERRITDLITLRSEGGTLGELVNVTSGNDSPSLTLINAGEPSDLEAKLPPFTLQRVHWGTIIDVLSKLLASQGLELSFSGGDSANPAEAKSVICVLRRIAAQADNGSPQSTFAAIRLSEYIFRDQTVDTITETILDAWKMDPKRDVSALQLRFNPTTKILLVSGPNPAAAIAREVVESLPKKPF
ncbi:MAG: hypothetical protein ABIZ81_03655 [Opitutaceae bacterium]